MAETGLGAGNDLTRPKNLYETVWESLRSIEYEIKDSGDGIWAHLDDGVGEQYGPSKTIFGKPAEVFLIALTVFEELMQTLIRDEPVAYHEDTLLSVLAICLRQALRANSPSCTSLMATLANASRIPRWRKPFGRPARYGYKYGAMPNVEQPEDSILLVALGVIAGTTITSVEDILRDALRLINNCCQDENGNREIVLINNGVARMMNLASRRIEADFVVPALYNICVDHDPAAKQLIYWKGDSPIPHIRSDSEDGFREASPSEGALKVLLNLYDALSHEERKPLLADLLELVSQSAAEDLNRLHGESPNKSNSDGRRIDLLTQLTVGPGSELAAFDPECRLAVCNTLVNLLSHEAFMKSLIAADLVHSFLSMGYANPPNPSQISPNLDENPEAEANLLQCRRAILKTLYSVCALPEFSAAYPVNTKLVQACVASLREPYQANSKYNGDEDGEIPPLSGAFVILTSLTKSEQIARSLVEEHKIYQGLSEILHAVNDPDVLYPAVNFIGRLALPVPNKAVLLEYGLLGTMRRFFGNDITPTVQREAITAARRLVTGSPQSLAIMRDGNPLRMTDQGVQDNELAAALALSRRTDDGSLKLEVGRLAIEVCRLLWASADGRPEGAENDFNSLVGPCRQAFAETIAFVVLHGEHPGARAEGWFGFAMMSVWTVGRELIVHHLHGEEMLAEVKDVVASGSGPAYQNLRLVLAKMNAVPEKAVSPHTRSVLESVAEQMGLGGIWSR